MNIRYPDYEHCLVNLACSIARYFGVETGNVPTLGICDDLLENAYQNVVVFLLDGLGKGILEENLEPDGFFMRHLRGTYSSVFPPTTVAATTSICSGQYPAGHSWLGWDCYYPQLDKNVTVFRNTESGSDRPAADYPVAQTFCPYEAVTEIIQRAGKQAYTVSPFAEPYPQSLEAVCSLIETLCGQNGQKYIYAYWPEPDTTIHKTGCGSFDTKSVLKTLEAQVQSLCTELSDTLLIVTADHGLVDSYGAAITDYPQILECLVRMPSIEPRAVNFFIKEGMHAQFRQEFQKEFGEKFLLLTKEEVKTSHLFGPGPEHPNLDAMLGDYLAVAVSDLSLYSTAEERDRFVSVHAGLTEAEMRIPMIAISIP